MHDLRTLWDSPEFIDESPQLTFQFIAMIDPVSLTKTIHSVTDGGVMTVIYRLKFAEESEVIAKDHIRPHILRVRADVMRQRFLGPMITRVRLRLEPGANLLINAVRSLRVFFARVVASALQLLSNLCCIDHRV